MFFTFTLGVIAAFAGSASAVAFLVWKSPPIMDAAPNDLCVEEESYRLIGRGKHHMDQVDAIETRLLEIHMVRRGSDQADELLRVVRDGEDYHETIERIGLWQ